MIQSQFAQELDLFLKRDFTPFHYAKNKADLYKFLNLFQARQESLDEYDTKETLAKLKNVLQHLKKTQKKIRCSNNLTGKKISVLRRIMIRLKVIFYLFQTIVYGNHKLNDLTQMAKTIEIGNAKFPIQVDVVPQKKETAAIKKFKHIVKKIQPIAIGNLVPKAIPLEKDYWLEAMGMRLVIDDKVFDGHIYTPFLITQNKYLEKWQTAHDNQGKNYCEQMSFEDYMNHIVIPQLSSEEKELIKSKLSIVEYFTPEQLADFEVHFDEEGKVCTANSALNQWVIFKEKNPDSTLIYTEFRESEFDPEDMNSPTVLRDQTYMYVVDHQGKLLLQIKNRGKINHSSLSNGHAILAAGSLKIQNGKIVEVDPFSGHYHPKIGHMKDFLRFLEKSKVNLNELALTYVANYDVQPWVILNVKPGDVEEWLKQSQV